MEIRVGTFNILNGSCRYRERMPLVKETIGLMNCDLLGVQEIHYQLNWPFLPKEGSTFFPVETPLELYNEPTFHIDGNAVFVRPPLLTEGSVPYVFETKRRSAGRVELMVDGHKLQFAVAHLDYDGDSLAVKQVGELLDFLAPVLEQDIILVGDFNFMPTSPAYDLIRRTFKSAFVERKKREPVITYPTGLKGEYMDSWMCGTFDYIFYRGNLQVTTAEIHGSQVVKEEGLWPSDHYALVAGFRFS